MKKETLVISGVNIVEGGALSVLKDCFDALIEFDYTNKYNIIALVNNKFLFKKYEGKIILKAFPKSKKSWFLRVFYEYFYFYILAKKLKPDVWISMHDTTPWLPSVVKQFVYCHNPSQFSNMKLKEAKYGIKYYLFSKFYKYLYAINIHNNVAVIVQQNWIREAFKKIYNVKNVVVARPSIPKVDNIAQLDVNNKNIFLYPSYPRYFKNFQVLCEAANNLKYKGITDFKVYITVDGTENQYSKELVYKYKNNKNIVFCGLLTRKALYELYGKSICLVFMSKLETFGMPIIEFKQTGNAIILSDLPYAHETIGDYNNVEFVNPDDSESLAGKMLDVIKNKKLNGCSMEDAVEEPYAKDWEELFKLIL